MSKAAPAQRPASVTHFGFTLVGVLGLIAAVVGLRFYFDGRPLGDAEIRLAAWVICLSTLAPVLLLDMLVLRTWKNASTGLDWHKKLGFNPLRVAYKVFGLAATLAVLAICYWAFPFYSGAQYRAVFGAFVDHAWWLVPLAIAYIAVVDAAMRQPEDEYWMVGYGLLRDRKVFNRQMLKNHALAWTVKGFFAPMMLVFLMGNTGHTMRASWDFSNPIVLVQFAIGFAYLIDLVFAVGGYLFTLRLTDTHMRSVEPTTLGWLVAIMCYPPFWTVINQHFLAYQSLSSSYVQWLHDTPAVMVAWGAVVAGLTMIYALSTVVFGLRFSNLTHRGIITGGPYRFCKHPAYLSKNIAWWLTAVPFIPMVSLQTSLKACLLLLGVNFIYYLRARTEERHLSRDPVYVAYAQYMDAHGPLRFLNRIFPVLRYKAPQNQ